MFQTVTQPEKHPKHNDKLPLLFLSFRFNYSPFHNRQIHLCATDYDHRRMQSRNPTIVCKSNNMLEIFNRQNVRPPAEIKINLKKTQVFKEINGFESRRYHATGLHATTQNIFHLHIQCRREKHKQKSRTMFESNIKVGQVESIHYFDSTYYGFFLQHTQMINDSLLTY